MLSSWELDDKIDTTLKYEAPSSSVGMWLDNMSYAVVSFKYTSVFGQVF